MKIRIKAFASARESFGFEEKELIVSEDIRVRSVVEQLKKNGGNGINPSLLFAINEQYCDADATLSDGDVLAIFPPVSGG